MSRKSGIGAPTSGRRSQSTVSRVRGTPSSSSSSGTSTYWKTVMGPNQSPERNGEGSSSRPFKCDEGCAQVFTQKSHLNQHVRAVHEGLRPFHCTLCNRSFGKKYDLTSHLDAVHFNIRNHICNECGKAFSKRSNLVRHCVRVHKMHVSE